MLDELENDQAALLLNGQTQIIPVLGFPVQQVRSPRPFTLALQRLGVNAIQIPLLVSVDTFAQVVTTLKQVGNVSGFILTVPHKVAAAALADNLSVRAQAAGSINALRREADGSWTGDIFDGAGFVTGLRTDGHDPLGKSVMIVGLGGAGAALAATLAEAGVAQLQLFDIDPRRARQIAERLRAHYPDLLLEVLEQPSSTRADIAVNATHLGMQDHDALPFEPTLLKPDAVVADIIMNPAETRLLRQAAAAGHSTVKGENVLFYQLDLLAGFFAHSAP